MKTAKEFSSFEQLLSIIEEEKNYGNYIRFNWKLLLLPDYSSLRNFFDFVSQRTEKFSLHFIDDEGFLKKGKSWIDVSDIERIIKAVRSNKNAVLFGVDNILRFLSDGDIRRFIHGKLFQMERLKVNSYLFIPLAGVGERMINIIREHHRVKSREIELPVYAFKKTSEEDRVKIFINVGLEDLPETLPVINDLKSFLQIWKEEKPCWLVDIKKLLSLCENPKPDSAVEVIALTNYKQLIEEFLNFKGTISDEKKFFIKQLIREILEKKAKTWKDLCKTEIRSLKDVFIHIFNINDDYERWKLINYAREVLPEYHSIFHEDLKEMIVNFYSSKIKNKKSIIQELINHYSMAEDIICQAIGDLVEDIDLNLGVLKCEVAALIKAFADGKIDINTIKEKSKELNYYLNSWEAQTYEQTWVDSYFNLYKEAKLKNVLSEELKSRLRDLNKDESMFNNWYHSFPLISELSNNTGTSYLIDGMGVEWIGFITSVAKEYGYKVDGIFLSRAELPSITKFNKVKCGEKIDDFDPVLHERYDFPNSIIKQMRVLKKILDRIFINGKSEITIFSDHGATAFSRLTDSINICTMPEHDGRYCKGENGTPYGIVIEKNGEKFTIAKYHNSLGRKPSREAHGGATPEEVLIPVIKLSKTQRSLRYTVKLYSQQVKRGGSLRLIFSPGVPDEDISIIIGRKELKFEQLSEKEIEIKLPLRIKAGEHKLFVKFGDEEIECKIKVIGGMEEEDLI